MPRPEDIVSRVRRALATRGLTLYQVSRDSARIFGRSSHYFIPEHFYADLTGRAVSPSIHQFAALSRVSKYCLADWLALFGIILDDIPRLQMLLPHRRTVLLDASVYDENEWIPWFAPRPRTASLSAISPLSEVLKPGPKTRARDLLALNTRQFLYAKVGREDFFAFPDLAPGSIARIDVLDTAHLVSTVTHLPSERIFVVETQSGLACGRLRRIGRAEFALCSTFRHGPRLERTLVPEARILGVVDAEIRPTAAKRSPIVSTDRRPRGTQTILPAKEPSATLGRLIRGARMRAGLSFRGASAMSRQVATILGDQTHFLSPGTLSEYDRLSTPPRQIQKILSLSILYCVGFWDFLRAGGLALELVGHDPMPDDLCGRTADAPIRRSAADEQHSRLTNRANADFLSALINQWKEIPLFLRHSLGEITGLAHPSLLDFFSVDPERDEADPRLRSAQLVAVDRRLKKPIDSPPVAPREPLMYMLVKRGGGYMCGACRLDRGILKLHRPAPEPPAPVETETHVDAEIIGQVTAILKRLS